MSLVEILAEDYGYSDVMDMLRDATFDSVAPSICVQCEYTCDMEPDQREGWCPECNTNTVKSCLVLEGLI